MIGPLKVCPAAKLSVESSTNSIGSPIPSDSGSPGSLVTVDPDPTPSGNGGCGSAPSIYATVDPSTLTSLHVTSTTLNELQPGNASAPAEVDVTVTDVATVRAVFNETNAVPCWGNGMTSCEVGPERDVQLAFTGSGGTYTFVSTGFGNCQSMSAGGTVFGRIGVDPNYWPDVALALGIPVSELNY